MLSKESVESPYCQAEFAEALRLKKRLIFIQVRDRTPLPEAISSRQYTDMSKGTGDPKIWTRLYNSIDHQVTQIPKRAPKPLLPMRTPRPNQPEPEPARPQDAPSEVTPTLAIPAEPVGAQPVSDSSATLPIVKPDGGRPRRPAWLPYVAILAVLVVVVGLAIVLRGADEARLVPTQVAGVTPSSPALLADASLGEGSLPSPSQGGEGAVGEVLPSETPTATITSTITLTPTLTETPDLIRAAQQVLEQQTAQAIIDAATATSARATQDESLRRTQSANLTATATLWTATYTPDFTQTVEAILTGWAQETATQNAVNATATATRWTKTPTPTSTHTPTFTPTPTLTPTLTPLEQALQRARTFAGTQNGDWAGFDHIFEDGVAMVLVPSGCFVMGNDPNAYYWRGSNYVQSVPDGGEQCFGEPFWIDRTEVTQADFVRLGGTKANRNAFNGDNRPVETITWFEAQAFCELRGGRLPSEAGWEYAARGVEGWEYPWGNTWEGKNAVWSRSSSQGTADVGSIPAGVSWVGALDMSGNVWEWTLSKDADYPYVANDGREMVDTTNAARVLRGGSWYDSYSVNLRSATRNGNVPYLRVSRGGFRCVRL